MTGKILTANRVDDGLVVFLNGRGEWAEALSEAWLGEHDSTIAEFEDIASAAGAGTEVTDVYLFDAERDGDEFVPAHIRERIRALGPTVRMDLGKQAEGIGGAFNALG